MRYAFVAASIIGAAMAAPSLQAYKPAEPAGYEAVSSEAAPPAYGADKGTETVYETAIHTITSCAPEVSDCK